ncbi:hypothetical protein H8958_020751 [Nasalis larvatus]
METLFLICGIFLTLMSASMCATLKLAVITEWKKHSSSTGGYYRCTRYEVIQHVEEQSKEMTVEAEKKHKRFQELDRFMHYYTRFKNHEHSYQTDLEMVTEDLAQKVNRPYLRTPRHKIHQSSMPVQQKRQEFLASVARGVAPADSPEAPRRRYSRRRQQQPQAWHIRVSSASMSVLHSSSLRDYTPASRSENQDSLQALSSLDEDDPNILLAIQLSLQESGLALDEETRDFLSNEASLGAIGTSLPSRLDSVPRNTESPRAALSSSELLELGDSLMRLGAESDPFSN